MARERYPAFGRRHEPEQEPDELERTYNDLKQLVSEDTGKFQRLSETLNKILLWMEQAKFRLAQIQRAELVEHFPVLRERVSTLKWLVVSQWGVIAFLALIIWKHA